MWFNNIGDNMNYKESSEVDDGYMPKKALYTRSPAIFDEVGVPKEILEIKNFKLRTPFFPDMTSDDLNIASECKNGRHSKTKV